MSVIDTLKKQGGLQLLKRYAKSGALFTALAEFLILGKNKKALEILRLSADLMQNMIIIVRILKAIKFGSVGFKEWPMRRSLSKSVLSH